MDHDEIHRNIDLKKGGHHACLRAIGSGRFQFPVLMPILQRHMYQLVIYVTHEQQM